MFLIQFFFRPIFIRHPASAYLIILEPASLTAVAVTYLGSSTAIPAKKTQIIQGRGGTSDYRSPVLVPWGGKKCQFPAARDIGVFWCGNLVVGWVVVWVCECLCTYLAIAPGGAK